MNGWASRNSAPGKYGAAADTLSKALSKTTGDADRLRLMRRIAETQYEGKQFDAAARQDELVWGLSDRLRSADSDDAERYVRWARSQRLGTGGAVRAVDALITGLTKPRVTAAPLYGEFSDLLLDAHGAALKAVRQKVDAMESGVAEPLQDPLHKAITRECLSAAEEAYAREDFVAMDAALREPDMLADDLSRDSAILKQTSCTD